MKANFAPLLNDEDRPEGEAKALCILEEEVAVVVCTWAEETATKKRPLSKAEEAAVAAMAARGSQDNCSTSR